MDKLFCWKKNKKKKQVKVSLGNEILNLNEICFTWINKGL